MHSFSEEGKYLSERDAPIYFFEAIFDSSQLKTIVRQTKSRFLATKFGVSSGYFIGLGWLNSLIDKHTTPNLKSTICLTSSHTCRAIDSINSCRCRYPTLTTLSLERPCPIYRSHLFSSRSRCKSSKSSDMDGGYS